MNVELGGTLFPHLPDVVGHDGHRPAAGQFDDVDIVTVSGTRTGGDRRRSGHRPGSHHQAIDRLGTGLAAAARSVEPGDGSTDPDGIVEAVDLADRRFVVGAQWHPEESGDRRLFDALVAAAR